MDLLTSPTLKSKYKKYKIRVKKWECHFMEEHRRKPRKEDIRTADPKIKEAYKNYWKMKTQALEDTLTNFSFSENDSNLFDNSVSMVNDQSASSDLSLTQATCEENTSSEVEKITPTTSATESDTISSPLNLEETCRNSNNNRTWGAHLNNKIKAKPDNKTSIAKSSSFQLSQKMFKSTISKRNPRKSLSTSKLRNGSIESTNVSFSQPIDATRLDEKEDSHIDEKFEGLFGNTFNIVNTRNMPTVQSNNTIMQLIEGKINTCKRGFDEGWLERTGIETDRTMLSQHSLLQSTDCETNNRLQTQSVEYKPEITSSNEKTQYSSDEDFICNSDSEEERKKKRVRNPRKIFYESTYQNSKRSCIKENVHNIPFNDSTSTCDNLITSNDQQWKPPVVNTSSESSKVEPCKEVGPKLADTRYVLPADNTNCTKEDENTRRSPKRNKKATSSNSQAKRTVSGTQTVKNKSQTSTRRSTRKAAVPTDETDEYETIPPPDIYDESLNDHSNLQPNVTDSGVPILPRFGNIPLDQLETEPKDSTSNSDLENKSNGKKSDVKSNWNDNFVRINIKKKVFVRGKRTFNYAKYKRTLWKQEKDRNATIGNLALADSIDKNGGQLICFKCGQSGHFAQRCPSQKSAELLPIVDDDAIDSDPLNPTLEEAALMLQPDTAEIEIDAVHSEPGTADVDELILNFEDFEDEMLPPSQQQKAATANGHALPQYVLDKLAMRVPETNNPVYPLEPDGSVRDTPLEVLDALIKFGHRSFRPGQEEAIMRILSGLSTLVTLSTGAGKSLCYQLPAYIYSKRSSCITLVISPLVSLMDDQVSGIPKCLSAACLHTNQTKKVRDKIIERLEQRTLQVLLVSPEAILSGEKSSTFGSIFRRLPPIAFACIDEVHCLSQWSHNFRPSYLMLCKILKEKLKVKTILGLTATATRSTVDSIMKHLEPSDGLNGVISDTPLPKNLHISISRDNDREHALIQLLRSDRFKECDSVIIYCTRREECNRIAGYLRSSFQNLQNPEKRNQKVSSVAEAYHAGLTAYRRRIVQSAFMAGDIKIVVATIAFGMGIDKSDIRSVIHYNMPAHFEGYVQEIGRAGRDGLDSHCHLFLNPRENVDKFELRRHIYSNGVGRRTIRQLLTKLFQPCSCTTQSNQRCRGHEVALPIDETVQSLDITEETIATLLCYLELHPKRFITVSTTGYITANVYSYSGPEGLKLAAKSCPPLAAALKLGLTKGTYNETKNVLSIPVIDVAAIIGYDSGYVKNQLKRLEWKNVNGQPKRTTINVNFETLGFIVRAPGDLSYEEKDDALNSLTDRCKSQEKLSLYQLEAIASTARQFSVPTIHDCLQLNENILSKSEEIKGIIRNYFEKANPTENIAVNFEEKLENEENVVADIRGLITAYHDNNFTGRAVARIFHGIQSPNYSALAWSRCRYWRAHLSEDFNAISRKADTEILKL